MALQREHWVSVEEYLAIDRASTDVKYEYMDGHIYAMSGGTIDHAEIAANLFFLLRRYLQGKACRAFSSDVRVQVAEKKYYYPDVTVSCNPEDCSKALMTLSVRLVWSLRFSHLVRNLLIEERSSERTKHVLVLRNMSSLIQPITW